MMIKSRAVGIIFPNMHDPNIRELTGHRTMASVPFGGRYRLIDFCLSGMVNAGMQNVGVIARENYQSLMDHLGNGREWDLSRKRGGLKIFPPYGREDNKAVYHGRIEALHSVLAYLEQCTEGYVVMSDCDVVCNLDYAKLLEDHRQTGADITVVYEKNKITECMQGDNVTFRVNDAGRVTEVRVNDYKDGDQNLSLNIYVVGREFLIGVVKDSMVRGYAHFERDFMARNLQHVHVQGWEYAGYRARICDMQSYFEETLRLLQRGNLEQLFPAGQPVYTKVRDEAPVRYAIGSKVTNSLVADGCIIEGEIENCVIFRGVRVRKGAKLKNCVIMQGSDIGPEAQLEYVVADKNVSVAAGQTLRGARSFPVFVAKGSTVV